LNGEKRISAIHRISRPSSQATQLNIIRLHNVAQIKGAYLSSLTFKKEEEEKFVEICLCVSFKIYNYELIKKF
jgi:hypothetical protein